MSNEEWYTVNYRRINECEGEDDMTVLSIDFSYEKQATDFYNTLVEGNECGQGYYAELLCYRENSVAKISKHEW